MEIKDTAEEFLYRRKSDGGNGHMGVFPLEDNVAKSCEHNGDMVRSIVGPSDAQKVEEMSLTVPKKIDVAGNGELSKLELRGPFGRDQTGDSVSEQSSSQSGSVKSDKSLDNNYLEPVVGLSDIEEQDNTRLKMAYEKEEIESSGIVHCSNNLKSGHQGEDSTGELSEGQEEKKENASGVKEVNSHCLKNKDNVSIINLSTIVKMAVQEAIEINHSDPEVIELSGDSDLGNATIDIECSEDQSEGSDSEVLSSASDSDTEIEIEEVFRKGPLLEKLSEKTTSQNRRTCHRELSTQDLPPVTDMKFNVSEEDCIKVGVVSCIVQEQVVVQALPNTPALNLGSVLFLKTGKETLGEIFDVLGQVKAPYYTIRFNSEEHARSRGVREGMDVYCAPKTEYTSYVFVHDMLKSKGTDASWEHNQEPPPHCLDYSDDEEERLARKTKNAHNLQENKKRKSFEGKMQTGPDILEVDMDEESQPTRSKSGAMARPTFRTSIRSTIPGNNRGNLVPDHPLGSREARGNCNLQNQATSQRHNHAYLHDYTPRSPVFPSPRAMPLRSSEVDNEQTHNSASRIDGNPFRQHSGLLPTPTYQRPSQSATTLSTTLSSPTMPKLRTQRHQAPLLSLQHQPPILECQDQAPLLLPQQHRVPMIPGQQQSPILTNHNQAPRLTRHHQIPLLPLSGPSTPTSNSHQHQQQISCEPSQLQVQDHQVPLLHHHKTPLLPTPPTKPWTIGSEHVPFLKLQNSPECSRSQFRQPYPDPYPLCRPPRPTRPFINSLNQNSAIHQVQGPTQGPFPLMASRLSPAARLESPLISYIGRTSPTPLSATSTSPSVLPNFNSFERTSYPTPLSPEQPPSTKRYGMSLISGEFCSSRSARPSD